MLFVQLEMEPLEASVTLGVCHCLAPYSTLVPTTTVVSKSGLTNSEDFEVEYCPQNA